MPSNIFLWGATHVMVEIKRESTPKSERDEEKEWNEEINSLRLTVIWIAAFLTERIWSKDYARWMGKCNYSVSCIENYMAWAYIHVFILNECKQS